MIKISIISFQEESSFRNWFYFPFLFSFAANNLHYVLSGTNGAFRHHGIFVVVFLYLFPLASPFFCLLDIPYIIAVEKKEEEKGKDENEN